MMAAPTAHIVDNVVILELNTGLEGIPPLQIMLKDTPLMRKVVAQGLRTLANQLEKGASNGSRH